MKKETKIQIIIITILIIILVPLVGATINAIDNKGFDKNFEDRKFDNPSEEKETSASDVESGETVTQKEINLSEYESNITIKDAGEYTLKGSFNNAVLIDSTSDVTLILDNVTIQNDTTATIANIGKGNLTIKLKDGTTNNLTDGGSSEYDACIYSVGSLTIEGNGTLNVYGKQSEGEGIATETNNITINGGTINIESNDDGINAGGDGGLITINNGDIYIKANGDGIDSNQDLVINGGNIYTIGSANGGNAAIDTDKGYQINGGKVIAIGSDMMEKPESSSKQKSLTFNMSSSIKSGSNISIKNESGEVVANFEAKEDFRTLIFSSENLSSGTYYLYQNEEKTNYSETI